jgi:hypothetical protein
MFKTNEPTTWAKLDNQVKITNGGSSWYVNKETAARAIENIKCRRVFYQSEEEYQERLNIYETALRMLE